MFSSKAICVKRYCHCNNILYVIITIIVIIVVDVIIIIIITIMYYFDTLTLTEVQI